MNVIAGSENQSFVGAGFFSGDLGMHVAGEFVGIEIDQVFFEGLRLGKDLTVRADDHAGSVENEAVVASDLVDHGDGDFLIARDGGEHIAAQFALP